MSDFDDLYNVTPNPFSEDEADQLLNGETTATRHSGEGADLGRLVHIARGAATPSELANQAAFLSVFATEIRVTTTPLQPERKRRMIKFISAKHSIKFVSIVAGVVFSAGAAAAATGSLPDPAQQVVSDVVSHIGIDVPSPDNYVADPPPVTTTTPKTSQTEIEHPSTSNAEVTVGTTETTAPAVVTTKAGDDHGGNEHEATTTVKITFGGAEAPQETTTTVREKHEDGANTPISTTIDKPHYLLCKAWQAQHNFDTGANSDETALHNVQQAASAAGFTVEGYCAFLKGVRVPTPTTTTTTHVEPTPTTKPAVSTTTHVEPTPTTKPATTTTTHVEPTPTTAAPTTTTSHVEPTNTTTSAA